MTTSASKAIVGWAVVSALLPTMLAGQGDPERGARIYHQGVLADGSSLRGTTVADVVLEGASVACVACHRRSGFGTSEGAAYVPPIAAPALFAPRSGDRAKLFRAMFQEVQPARRYSEMRDPRVRAAYDDASLGVVLRDGVDPSGRHLDVLMPRYALDDRSMADLIAYLHTLGDGPDPGVDDETIRFATVVTDGVTSEREAAMRDVIDAYVKRRNTDIYGQKLHRGHSLWHMEDFLDSYRLWEVDVWRLEGPSGSWPDQLERYAGERPAFALLGGIGEGDWQPVHAFCERNRVPCLFPNTDRPPGEQGDYALYLSSGLAVEARALARWIDAHHRQAAEDGPDIDVLHVTSPGDGQVASDAFARAFGEDGRHGVSLREVVWPHRRSPSIADWQRLLGPRPPQALVLWLDDVDLAALAGVPAIEQVETVVVSHTLLGKTLPEVPGTLRDRLRLTYRYALPGEEVPRIYRLRAWMRSRRIVRRHERIQLNTYFALSITEHALMHLVDRYSRDYFVEAVEHEAENALNPGVYPYLSLGPGQRFASKGSYVVKLSEAGDGALEAEGGWIVP